MSNIKEVIRKNSEEYLYTTVHRRLSNLEEYLSEPDKVVAMIHQGMFQKLGDKIYEDQKITVQTYPAQEDTIECRIEAIVLAPWQLEILLEKCIQDMRQVDIEYIRNKVPKIK